MKTSREGVKFLERHEGVVLRAYRDAVGVWTIGAGLTAASGVVTPKPGMVITAEEASRLLAQALERNYEPAVRRALSRYGELDCHQVEFDGAVSFHFNTGSIGRASWVEAWHRRDWAGVNAGLSKWVRGGGRVLPGLVRRRVEEYILMRYGSYDPSLPAPSERRGTARITLRLAPREIEAVRDGLRKLGHDPGPVAGAVALDAVARFQAAHGLTVDGILGRATLTTLQRRLDARAKAGAVAGAGGAGAAAQVPGLDGIVPQADLVSLVLLGGVAAAALWLAWRYRDVVAAKVQRVAPRTATWLRSR
jgi:lysozyme